MVIAPYRIAFLRPVIAISEEGSANLDAALVTLLLAAGANPRARDTDRRTARDLLPARDATNAAAWDEVSTLLGA